jgi:hypothetical protein
MEKLIIDLNSHTKEIRPGVILNLPDAQQLSFEFVRSYDAKKVDEAFDSDQFWMAIKKTNPYVLFHFKSAAAYVQDFVDANFEEAVIEIQLLKDFILLAKLISDSNEAKQILSQQALQHAGVQKPLIDLENDRATFLTRYPALGNLKGDGASLNDFLDAYAALPSVMLSKIGKWTLCVPVNIIGDVIPYPS